MLFVSIKSGSQPRKHIKNIYIEREREYRADQIVLNLTYLHMYIYKPRKPLAYMEAESKVTFTGFQDSTVR